MDDTYVERQFFRKGFTVSSLTLEAAPVPKPDAVDHGVFNTVMKWDITRVRSCLEHEYGLPQEYLKAVEQEWKKYIVLLAIYPERGFPMSAPVDQFAHEHLLDTHNMQALCEEIAPGRVMHHEPTIGEEEKQALLPLYHSDTIPMMEMHFGEASLIFWPRDRCVCRYNLK